MCLAVLPPAFIPCRGGGGHTVYISLVLPEGCKWTADWPGPSRPSSARSEAVGSPVVRISGGAHTRDTKQQTREQKNLKNSAWGARVSSTGCTVGRSSAETRRTTLFRHKGCVESTPLPPRCPSHAEQGRRAGGQISLSTHLSSEASMELPDLQSPRALPQQRRTYCQQQDTCARSRARHDIGHPNTHTHTPLPLSRLTHDA